MGAIKKVTTGTTRTYIKNRLQTSKGASIASAGTITLGNDGNTFAITGTTAIDYITTTNWDPGAIIILIFSTSVTLNHNTGTVPATAAALLCFGAANVSATANDAIMFVYDGTNWRQLAPIAAI